jgi:CRISPR-associated protein Csd1
LDSGLAVYFEKKLSELYCAIGTRTVPTVMNAEQQTEFALGYYQQRAALYAPKAAAPSEN